MLCAPSFPQGTVKSSWPSLLFVSVNFKKRGVLGFLPTLPHQPGEKVSIGTDLAAFSQRLEGRERGCSGLKGVLCYLINSIALLHVK